MRAAAGPVLGAGGPADRPATETAPSPRSASPPLDAVQRWFQAVITHPGGVQEGAAAAQAEALVRLERGELEEVVRRSRNLTAHERLSIYANAYYARLLECMGECFPLLKRALGDEVFDGFAFEYLERYPSRSYTLDRLGENFTRFLAETRPDRPGAPPLSGEPPEDTGPERLPGGQSGSACRISTLRQDAGPELHQDLRSGYDSRISTMRQEAGSESPPEVEAASGAGAEVGWPDFLIDLAALEWTIAKVFDGPGVEGETLLAAADLAGLDPASFAQVALVPVPCLRLLAFRYPVNSYFSAALAGSDSSPPLPSPAAEYVALNRREFVVRRHPLSRPQYLLLQALAAGTQVGEALEVLAAVPELAGLSDDELAAELRSWFASWAAAGFFRAIGGSPVPHPRRGVPDVTPRGPGGPRRGSGEAVLQG